MKEEGYGSMMHEVLKKSMEKPATSYKPLNMREPQRVRVSVLITVFILILWLGITGLFLFDKFEGLFR